MFFTSQLFGTLREAWNYLSAVARRSEAAMKAFLLTGLLFAMPALAIANDGLKTHNRAELHAAVTDIPVTVDMSYADPLTWHRLPGAVEFDVPGNDFPCLKFRIGLETCTPTVVATR
jgi:hypothetical protein